MWENERKKTIIRNVIICLVLVLVASGLFVAMNSVRKQIAEEDALLSAERTNQRQEMNEARQENLDVLQQTYEKDLETVAQYLPGIVCWGDSLTAGSSGNVSYPIALQKCINTYLCDIYDIRFSLDNPETYSRVNWEDYQISIPVVNMGAGQEGAATVLGRAGVVPYVVKTDFVIPAGKESVPIFIESEDGRTVSPLTAGSAGVNPVTIAGVEGTLVRTSNAQGWGQSPYQFTRLEEGAETPVAKGTEIVTSCMDEYRDYIHIVWLGTYGDYGTPEKLVSDTKALLQRQNINGDRFLVIGPCTTKGTWGMISVTSLDAIDSAMLQAFGNHYINLRKYLIEDGLRDAGLSSSGNTVPGTVPVTFRSYAGGADMNSVAYQLIGKLVYERMDSLGYFDEVRAELNLDKITQEILKSDPEYFDSQLKMD